MSGGSSTTKEEHDRTGAPLPFLGAVGSVVGGAGFNNSVVDPPKGSLANAQATATIAEGVHQQEK